MPLPSPLRPLWWLLLFAGCTPKVLRPLPPAQEATTYEVIVAVGHGRRMVSSANVLEIIPVKPNIWRIRTTRSQGTWEEGGEAISYDSAAPMRSDPWMLTLQYAVSSTPAAIQFDERGRPNKLMDTSDWMQRAHEASLEAPVAELAQPVAESLIDPEGLLRDLARNFPGEPAADGQWTRQEWIGGLDVQRIETCTSGETHRGTRWHCTGELRSPEKGSAGLVATQSITTVTIDRLGLLEHFTEYSATLVQITPTGMQVDRPLVGMRKVSRRQR